MYGLHVTCACLEVPHYIVQVNIIFVNNYSQISKLIITLYNKFVEMLFSKLPYTYVQH